MPAERYNPNSDLLPFSDVVSLTPGQSLHLNTLIPENGETPIIACIYTSHNADKLEQGDNLDYFKIIDLRSANINSDGTKKYQSYSIDPTVEYLVLGKNPDLDYGKEFKGLRRQEGEIVFGRFDMDSMRPDDHRRRFNTMPTTSRNHFSIRATSEGVSIRDLESLNGTTVSFDSATLSSDEKYISHMHLQESDQERIINKRLIQEIKHSSKDPYKLTERLVADSDTAPVQEINIDNQRFLLSPIQEGERKFVVLYARMPDGRYAPRLLYKSHSDGGWRITRFTIGRNAHFDKGIHDEDGGYTQETKPNDKLIETLREMEDTPGMHITPTRPHIAFEFNVGEVAHVDSYTYEDEVKFELLDFEDLYKQSPGLSFEFSDGRPAREHFSELTLPPDLMPNFSRGPEKTYSGDHSLLGSTITDVYVVTYQGKTIEWHITSDKDGRVWIEKLKDANSKTTTYGTNSPVILAGMLNNKPIEYRSQANGLEYGIDYEDMPGHHYVDITKLLDNLPVIKEYRYFRKIERNT